MRQSGGHEMRMADAMPMKLPMHEHGAGHGHH